MKLKLILGDQLNLQHSWFKEVDSSEVFVLMEMRQETDYAPHHIQKVVAFFGAMRNFSEVLKQAGHQVHYLALDDKANRQQLEANLNFLIEKFNADGFAYMEPDEYRLDQQLKEYVLGLNIPSEVVETEHFMTSRSELTEFFEGKKQLILEF